MMIVLRALVALDRIGRRMYWWWENYYLRRSLATFGQEVIFALERWMEAPVSVEVVPRTRSAHDTTREIQFESFP